MGDSPGSAHGTPMEEFTGGFYRNPRASLAVAAFHSWVSDPGANPASAGRMFVRAIQHSDGTHDLGK
jgi:hypothetical protein